MLVALLSSDARASQMHQDIHGLPISTASAGGRGGVRPHGARLSEISRRHGGAARRGARGRRRVRPRALPEGLLRAAVLQAGERAGGGRGRAGRRGGSPRTRRRASRRMWRRSRPGSAAISTARSASGKKFWASIRSTCWRFASRISTISGSGGRATMRASVERVKPKWSTRPDGLRHGPVLPLLRARGVRRLRDRRALGPRRDRDRSGRHLGHARGRAHHGDAGPPRRRHRVARRAGAALGGRQQSAASSVVAPRAVPSRAARIRRGARSLRPALPQSRQSADAGAARPLHRRAERRLDAVPPRAARHRCRRRAGTRSPTRPRRASATASRRSRCRTG